MEEGTHARRMVMLYVMMGGWTTKHCVLLQNALKQV